MSEEDVVQAVETEVPEVTEETQTDAQSSTETEGTEKPESEDPDGKPESYQQKRTRERISKLLEDRWRARGEADALRKQLEDLQGRGSQQTTPQSNEPQKPKRDQFTTDEEYVEALVDYKTSTRLQNVTQEQMQQTQAAEAQKSFKASEIEVRKAHPDYDDVVAMATDVIIPNAAIEAILSSPNGAAIRYHLALNPDEAEKLNLMSPVAAVREIGKLEGKMEATKKLPASKVSGAPAPAKSVGTRGSVNVDPDKMSDAEWFAMKRKQRQQAALARR